MDSKTMRLEERELILPVIKFNFEELKAELNRALEEYKGLVVTEDTLTGCKAAQKELAGLRNKIDTARKEKKKELEQPIKVFEAQCKELISLVESVELPIKEGIKVYDDQKREEKRQQALELIAEVAEATGLNEKYAAQLTVIDKYMNLTATKKAVKEDLETRAFALKVEQDREQERLDIIQSVIDSENQRIKTKLCMEDFEYCMMYSNIPTAEVIQEIKQQAQKIHEAENKPVEPAKEPQGTEMPPQPEKTENEAQAQPQGTFRVVFEVVGDYETQHKVSDFLKANGITYKVTSQVRV